MQTEMDVAILHTTTLYKPLKATDRQTDRARSERDIPLRQKEHIIRAGRNRCRGTRGQKEEEHADWKKEEEGGGGGGGGSRRQREVGEARRQTELTMPHPLI